MDMKFIGIIPARYASTRFPGKPLAVLGGKTVIQRVYEQWWACSARLMWLPTTSASTELWSSLEDVL